MERSGASGIERVRKGFSLFGLLLIALGVLLLLNVVGALPLGVWFELAKYWPALLVIVGVKMLLAPRAPLVGLAAVSLILVAAIAAASFTMDFRHPADAPVAASYETPLGDVETLELGMGFAGGSVTLRPAPTGGSQPLNLFAADFDGAPADVIHDRRGPDSKIYLSTGEWSLDLDDGLNITMGGDAQDFPGAVDWDLFVSPDVALDLEISAGASDLYLDLRRLNVKRLVVGAAASDVTIILPEAAGRTEIEIDAAVADVRITVPAGVAARFEQESLLSQIGISTSRFPQTSGGYESPNYAVAENRVSVEINAAASDLTVH